MNILVIQDQADETASIREALAAEGFTIVSTRTVQEAIDHSNGSRVGVVLLGGCPDANGLRDLVAGAPVMVVTGHADLLSALTALRDQRTVGPLQEINPSKLRGDSVRVCELRAAERQVGQMAQLAGVGELAASVAHELNNALGTVTLRLEALLAKTNANDPGRHSLEIVDQEVERMAALVSNLLEFTRSGRGQTSTVDVCDEVNKTIELTHHHLTRKGITVTTQFALNVPLIQADRQQLRQVLLNLFTNAADAMPQGGQLHVLVRSGELTDGRPGIVLEVEDTGTGIPPEILARVMETFFTTKPEGKGTGLGLSICKRIVEQHGGQLVIESEVGVGTTVRISLPLRPEPVVVGSGRRESESR